MIFSRQSVFMAFVAFVAALSIIRTEPVYANPSIEALSNCLADNTSGKERKDLARWMFLAMAVHPEMRELSNPSKEVRESASRLTGQLFTRLLTENCLTQVRALSRDGATNGIVSSFEFLGKLAMQELVANKDVNDAISGIDRYVDKVKLEKIFVNK
jgi:hypothetical protein